MSFTRSLLFSMIITAGGLGCHRDADRNTASPRAVEGTSNTGGATSNDPSTTGASDTAPSATGTMGGAGNTATGTTGDPGTGA